MLDMTLLDAADLMSIFILCREEDDEEISNDRPLSWGFVPDRPPDFQLEGRRHPPLLGLQRCVIYLGWPIAPSYMSPYGMRVGRG
jgi:hypothetical protein